MQIASCLGCTFRPQLWDFIRLILCWSWGCCHNLCEFLFVSALLCLESMRTLNFLSYILIIDDWVLRNPVLRVLSHICTSHVLLYFISLKFCHVLKYQTFCLGSSEFSMQLTILFRNSQLIPICRSLCSKNVKVLVSISWRKFILVLRFTELHLKIENECMSLIFGF